MKERAPRRVKNPDNRHRYPGEIMDLTGQRFGRLTALVFTKRDGYGRSSWMCRCDCGGSKEVRAMDLRSGSTASCGCLRKYKLANPPHDIGAEEHW